MDELDEKDLEGAGMHTEDDHVMGDLGDDDLDAPKKKPIIPEEDGEFDGSDADDDDDDELIDN